MSDEVMSHYFFHNVNPTEKIKRFILVKEINELYLGCGINILDFNID